MRFAQVLEASGAVNLSVWQKIFVYVRSFIRVCHNDIPSYHQGVVNFTCTGKIQQGLTSYIIPPSCQTSAIQLSGIGDEHPMSREASITAAL